MADENFDIEADAYRDPAAGYAGVLFDPAKVTLHLNGILLYERGCPVDFDPDAVSQAIAAERDTPVFATASGTVTFSRRRGAYGNLVVVDHGFGLETRYGHLSKFEVTQGDQVQRGDIIGRVGATGRATGYHVHYEVLANGRLLNPLQLLTQKPRDR